ncbi:4040_t:CDS:2, partial [Cetraspora pellucida]
GGGIGKIKIADFGLSKVVWDEQTMTPCGTVGYTAPEIVKEKIFRPYRFNFLVVMTKNSEQALIA